MASFPFDPEVEQMFVGALDDTTASAVLEKITKEHEACKKKASRKKSKGKAKTPIAGTPLEDNPTNPGDDESGNTSADEAAMGEN